LKQAVREHRTHPLEDRFEAAGNAGADGALVAIADRPDSYQQQFYAGRGLPTCAAHRPR
jgi:hypothetical protein